MNWNWIRMKTEGMGANERRRNGRNFENKNSRNFSKREWTNIISMHIAGSISSANTQFPTAAQSLQQNCTANNTNRKIFYDNFIMCKIEERCKNYRNWMSFVAKSTKKMGWTKKPLNSPQSLSNTNVHQIRMSKRKSNNNQTCQMIM